jgi:hypothetical protein
MYMKKPEHDVTSWEFDLRTAFRDAIGIRMDQIENEDFVNGLVSELKEKSLRLGPAAQTLYNQFGPDSPYRGHHHLWNRVKRVIVMIQALEFLGQKKAGTYVPDHRKLPREQAKKPKTPAQILKEAETLIGGPSQ